MSLLNLTIERIHSQGGRMTSQRRTIIETLQVMEEHPTAEQIHGLASEQDESIHLSTVYRTLRWLEKEELIGVRRLDTDSRKERFDPVLPIEHFHFQCSICKQVIEFDDPAFQELIDRFEANHSGRVESSSVIIRGICSSCLTESEHNGDGR